MTAGWLIEAMRPRREPVPWAQMARAVLAICVPLATGLAVGKPQFGLLLAIGGLLGSVVDRGGPYLLRLRRVSAAGVFGGAVGLTIGSVIHGRGWVAVAVLVLLAGASAVISAVSDTASVTALQLLVYSSFGTGPLGALRPWWIVPLTFLGGVAWAMVLILPGWLLFPRAPEQRRVAQVYSALARKLRAVGTDGFATERGAVTAALNSAYDEVLTVRLGSAGRDRRLVQLVALLNQAHLVAEASTALAYEGQQPPPEIIHAARALADAIGHGGRVPVIPPPPAQASAGMRALHAGLAGAVGLLRGGTAGPGVGAGVGGVAGPGVAGGAGTGVGGGAPRRGARWGRGGAERVATALGRIRGGRVTRMFALRLMACIGLAAVVSEVLPLQRSYWVVLTVAIVLKPDFGSVFARAIQRGVGTVVGAVIGAVLLAVLPPGPLLLVPMAVCAALLPYGRNRNYGLFSVFLTPLVVLLIDLLAHGGWRLAEARLIDTVAGCAIVLLVGYAAWPMGWYADLPRHFADAVDAVVRYTCSALTQNPAGRTHLRRQAYRALWDLRVEFQRTMAEPPAVSRRATAWWPAVIALERVMDTVTMTAVAADQGQTLPPAGSVAAECGALHDVASAVRSGGGTPQRVEVPDSATLRPVTETVRSVLDALAGVIAPDATPQRPLPKPDG